MAGTQIYHYDDASAPSCTQAVGALITLLDAILVNGYGSKSSLGWTKSFSGTNKAVYKQGSGSAAHYLRVDDSANAAFCNEFYGAKTATGIDTVTNKFGALNTTETASSFVIKPQRGRWHAVGNEKGFYLILEEQVSDLYEAYYFGDIESVCGSNDLGRTLIAARQNSTIPTTSTANTYSGLGLIRAETAPTFSNVQCTNMCGRIDDSRNGTGAVMTWLSNPGLNVTSPSQPRYPSEYSSIPMARVEINVMEDETTAGQSFFEFRGYMPGIYLPRVWQQLTLPNGTTFNGGSGTSLSGKSFIAYNITTALPVSGPVPVTYFFETSSTWNN